MMPQFTPVCALLQSVLPSRPEESPIFPGAELDLGQYLLVCGLLLGMLLVLGWVFRRFVGGAWRSKAAARSLAVLDVLPLAGRQKLCVVRCYDRTFALGLGDREVTLIAELDPTGAVSVAIPARPAVAAAPVEAAPVEAAPVEAAGDERPAEAVGSDELRPGDRRTFARELLRRHAELVESELAPAAPVVPHPKSGLALSEAERVRAALRRGQGILG